MTVPAVAMVNVLGDLWFEPDGVRREPAWERALDDPHAFLHLYGKSVPRLGRKMGHLTVTADDVRDARQRALTVRASVTA